MRRRCRALALDAPRAHEHTPFGARVLGVSAPCLRKGASARGAHESLVGFPPREAHAAQAQEGGGVVRVLAHSLGRVARGLSCHLTHSRPRHSERLSTRLARRVALEASRAASRPRSRSSSRGNDSDRPACSEVLSVDRVLSQLRLVQLLPELVAGLPTWRCPLQQLSASASA